MDEARGLLERLVTFAGKNVDGLKVTNYDIYTSAGQQLIDDTLAFLAQPEPAAREAVLAEMLKRAPRDDARCVVAGCHKWSITSNYYDGSADAPVCGEHWLERKYDTSPAAAALLAQGEALRRLESVTRSYLQYPLKGEEPGYDAKDVLAYCDEARAALAPGEPT